MHPTIFLTIFFSIILLSISQHTDSPPSPTPPTIPPATSIIPLSSAESRLKSAYTTLPGMTSFASGWLSLENQYFSTQTIIPGIVPTATNWEDIKGVKSLEGDRVLKFGTEYKMVVMQYVATQTFVTGAPRKTLQGDVDAYLDVPQMGGARKVGVRIGVLIAVVVAGAIIGLL